MTRTQAVSSLLTPRWYPLRPHPEQTRLLQSKARFRVVPAGRRSGKTERAKRILVRAAMAYSGQEPGRFFAAAPTRDQAKAIFWDDLKRLSPEWLISGEPRESDLSIKYSNGNQIVVVGMDKPQRIEGRPWDGGVLDEYANMKPSAWSENVRPALSDRRGWCWLIGVPEGRGHYYELARRAQADTSGEWGYFTWKSADILPPEEIESAKADLDPLVFQQEYEASFLNFQGRIYYNFDETAHCARLAYDPASPIAICFDFNVAPGVAVICQEQKLPNGGLGTGVIGEVWIPRDSNTLRVCDRVLRDWGSHQGPVLCYGDATGGAGGSAKVLGSDWVLIRNAFRAHFGNRVSFRVPQSNPAERSRVNAVNTRLKNGAGEIKLMIDPGKAPHLVYDFEGVQALEGGSGEIDKRKTPDLTHISDAIGYYVTYEFPVISRGGRLHVAGVY